MSAREPIGPGHNVPRTLRQAFGHPGPAIEGFDPERQLVGPALAVLAVLVLVLLLLGVIA